ncbi:MAG: histidine phosphatase family protein [Mogibacterium sp.]|nr:histidine phosphatase family protein [Mogibacterium sp.]MBQ6500988.1 histidine phosphatase family protein [Mogibacterium sp.]
MKILIIRHAEPDYTIDSLTEKGWREAEYLSEMLAKQLDEQNRNGQVYFYMSPYGRAQDTASLTLKKLGRTAEVLPWLREFDIFIWRPDDTTRKRIPWDWTPGAWMQDPRLYQADHWFENELMSEGNVGEEYCKVAEQFDELLARHGYRRDGGYYRAERSNHDTLVLFCHFGVEGVLLSHLLGVSPMPVWHGLCALPSTVTTLVTEERREGIAVFRILAFGERAHLYVHDEEPSFAARFCECYEDDTRHD